MKNKLYILLCSAVLICAGCSNQESAIFSTSPAERLKSALKMDTDSLQNAENGWEMEYFATKQSPGYTLLVKFSKSGQAIISEKSELTNNSIITDSCMYEMIGDNGPVLTFNTYNKVLHAFSNPVSPNGYGLEGDYEFIIMKRTANQIILQGKKRGTTILLNKIPKDITWEEYFAQIDDMNTLLFGGTTNSLNMVIGTDTLEAINGASHIFKISKQGSDPQLDGVDYPFIITTTGIRFNSPYTINGNDAQTFTLSTDKQQLQCTNSSVKAYFIGTNPAKYYLSDSTTVWNFSLSKPMGSKFQTLYNKLVTNCQNKLSEKFSNLYFRNTASRGSYTLSFKSGKYIGYFDIQRINIGQNKVKFEYKGTSDVNGTYYLNNIEGFNELIQYIGKTYIVSADIAFNLNTIKFTAEDDATISFYVFR